MRRYLCGIALGAFLAVAANLSGAQSTETNTPPPPPPGGHWGHGPMDPATMAAHLARRLSLSAEQQTQVQTILVAQEAERKSLEQNQTITHQQFLAQTRALHEQSEGKIEALLNDTQKQQFVEMKSHMHPGPPPSGEAGPPPSEQ